MSSGKVKIPPELYAKLKTMAAKAGYASTEEFVIHILERETAGPTDASADEQVREKLKGLGYIG